MTTATDRLRTQQELAGEDDDWIREHISAALLNVHTITVGIVTGYDQGKQTCTVQPAIKRLRVDGGAIAIRECLDVPVVFPGGGVVTFDVEKGMECLLLFAERCIDRWFVAGGVQEPEELRFHDLSDGFALIGPNSVPNLVAALGSGVELRTKDGANRIALRDGKVLLGAATATGVELQPPINGVVLASGIDPLTKMTYYALGSSSQNVMAKR